jgi:Family of unknown function (DUF6302)
MIKKGKQWNLSEPNAHAKGLKFHSKELEYWTQRLAEPELLKTSVLLDVEANETPLAVPVGKLRRGGHIEFMKKREVLKGLEELKRHSGFPSLQAITCRDRLTGRPMRYYELRWGQPPPFDGCDWGEPICALLLGVHYGYREEAIANLVQQYQEHCRHRLDRTTIFTMIKTVRNLGP